MPTRCEILGCLRHGSRIPGRGPSLLGSYRVVSCYFRFRHRRKRSPAFHMTIRPHLYRIPAEICPRISRRIETSWKGRIAMYRSSIRLLAFVALALLVMSAAPARAEEQDLQSSHFQLLTADNVSIHVHRKIASGLAKVPVLLIHGTWGDARTWDFPGRSVMDHLAVEGYDVYALDLRGIGNSDKPANYFTIDIGSRVNDAVAVASYI